MTLQFLDKGMEEEYRSFAHKPDTPGDAKTLASPTFNTYFDVIVSALTFFALSVICFMLFPVGVISILVFCPGTLFNLSVMLLCILKLTFGRSGNGYRKKIAEYYEKCMEWYSWHCVGSVLLSFPLFAVLCNLNCSAISELDETFTIYGYGFWLGLVHFGNFTQLNCWMKSILATIGGVAYVIVLSGLICPCPFEGKIRPMTDNSSAFGNEVELYESRHMLHYEIVVDVFLLLLLVWYLNREFEISFRMSFHCNVVASRGKAKVQTMKNQADWLLNNIMPENVVEVLKNTAKYSENHKNVGIIFASIVNFNEMYDETYFGGKEYLRFLNELIGDFDELLNKPEFQNVDKIKTIGSTYMAASGLDSQLRERNSHPNQHLFELIEFALAMQKAVEDFNRDLLEFNLIIRIGFNSGDVTSGVLGTSKLLYDIWGDAVNIASRMDSTGVNGRIQFPVAVVDSLNERYETEERGTIFVKGKNDMKVFLLKSKKLTDSL